MLSRVTNFLRNQSRNFKVLLVYGIVVGGGMRQGIVHSLTQQYTDLYTVALGASKIELGLIQSIGTATRIIFSIPIGGLIDKINLKKILLLGMLLEFLSVLTYAFAGNWYIIVPAVILLALSWDILGIVNNILRADSLGNANRATGYSILSTVSMMPGLIMPLLAAYIIDSFGGLKPEGIRPLFYIQFIMLVPVSLWVYRSLEKPEKQKQNEALSLFRNIKKFIAEKGLRIWLLVGILDSFAMVSFPFLNVYAVEVKNATTSIIALMGIASTFTSILFLIPIGRLADKIGRKPSLYVGLIPTWAWILILLYSP